MDTITDEMIIIKCCCAICDVWKGSPALPKYMIKAITVLCSAIVGKKITTKKWLRICLDVIFNSRYYGTTVDTVINSGAVFKIINNLGEGNDVKLVISSIGILAHICKKAP
jgi:hypothetical protein